MSRGKSFTREQQKKAARAKKGLAKYMAEDETGLAGKIGSRSWIFDEYRKIYNKCCPACKALIQKTGGRAAFTDYCPECQRIAAPHLKNIQVMLGRSKE